MILIKILLILKMIWIIILDNDFENESFNEDNSYVNENKFNNIYEISYNVYSNKNKKMKRKYLDITNSDCDKINEI